LTYRVSRLIEDGVDPGEILLLTFTNKSSREMLSRVEQLVTIDTRRISGGTFHSIGNRLLRRHADAIGYRSNFTILDSEDANAMDFDDLLVNWKLLLEEHPDVSESLKRRYRFILVDEYQDTNKLQADVVDAMASVRRNVMVVGDDAQSIYSFRGASFENILTFPLRFPEAKIYKLETNYRSTRQILNLANQTIAHNRYQFQKELQAVRCDGPEPAV